MNDAMIQVVFEEEGIDWKFRVVTVTGDLDGEDFIRGIVETVYSDGHEEAYLMEKKKTSAIVGAIPREFARFKKRFARVKRIRNNESA